MVNVQSDTLKPFSVNSFVKRFCEKICWVFDSWNMCNIYDTVVDTVPDEVSANVDVFHVRVRVWVVTTSDRALIVAVKDRCSGLFETEFVEKRVQPNNLPSAMRARKIFGFT